MSLMCSISRRSDTQLSYFLYRLFAQLHILFHCPEGSCGLELSHLPLALLILRTFSDATRCQMPPLTAAWLAIFIDNFYVVFYVTRPLSAAISVVKIYAWKILQFSENFKARAMRTISSSLINLQFNGRFHWRALHK